MANNKMAERASCGIGLFLLRLIIGVAGTNPETQGRRKRTYFSVTPDGNEFHVDWPLSGDKF